MFRKLVDFSVKMMQRWLPEPFILAIILTLVVMLCAMPICHQSLNEVIEHWGNGVWSLLTFAMQMALVLVCGSALATAPSIKRGIEILASIPKSSTAAILWVTLISCVACWINWGFGLIIGVVFAKEIAKKVRVDYRLLIASAYSGFVVWHAGFSGSIPLTMATKGAQLSEVTQGAVVNAIPLSQTIFSLPNILIVLTVVVVLLIVNVCMQSKENAVFVNPDLLKEDSQPIVYENTPAEKLENSVILGYLVSFLGLAYLAVQFFVKHVSLELNHVIMIFLILGLLFHKTPIAYVRAFSHAVQGSAGIMLQFPFYAGIMGVLMGVGESGLCLGTEISDFFIRIATPHTYPIMTFLSAGIVNVFVPSGGGQWAVQAPIMFATGKQLGVDPAITGMAIAWGDAWTNLIQPFWALPALAIAKLNAKDIMGVCLINLILIGIVISVGLLIWSW